MKKKPTTETPEFLNGLTKLELLKYALGGGRERKILEEDRNEKLNSLINHLKIKDMKDLTKKELEMLKRYFDMGVEMVSIGSKSYSKKEYDEFIKN